MRRVNVYNRKDGRWEGRISRGKRTDGSQYILARTREDVIAKTAEIRVVMNSLPESAAKPLMHFSRSGSVACSTL